MNSRRFAVVGAGAVGGYFAAVLARAGFWVGVVARGEHVVAIRRSGLNVQTPDGEFTVTPALVTSDPTDIGPVDAVIIAVKTWQLAEAARGIGPLLGSSTKVLPIQNGVEASSQLQEILGREFVLNGSCRISSELVSPGRIKHVGYEPTVVLGETDDSELSQNARALVDALIASGVAVQTPPRIQVALWEKLLFLAPMSGVASLARATAGEIRQCVATRELLEQLMREVASVAQAVGVPLDDDAVSRSLEILEAMPGKATLSMQRDIAAGRRSELEAIIGSVIRFGGQSGVPTPAMNCVYARLLLQESRNRTDRGQSV